MLIKSKILNLTLLFLGIQLVFFNQLLNDYTTTFCILDCAYYKEIAINGYNIQPKETVNYSGETNWAFFPLFPLVLKTINLFISNENLDFYASLINIFFSTLGLLFSLLLFRKHSKSLLHLTLLFALNPFTIYFIFPYTESLFFFLTALFFYLFYEKNKNIWLIVLVFSSLTITRPVGLLLSPILAYHVFKFRHEKSWLDCLFILLVSGLFFSLFCIYNYFQTGDALAFFNAQISWNRSTQNFFNLIKEIQTYGYTHLLFQLFVFILIFLILLNESKAIFFALSIFCFLNLLIPILSGSLDSFSRYASVLILLYYYLANKIAEKSLLFKVTLYLALFYFKMSFIKLFIGGSSLFLR